MPCLSVVHFTNQWKSQQGKHKKPESANRGEKAASTDERDITEELNWRAIFVISASAHWLDRTVCTFANSACKEVSP